MFFKKIEILFIIYYYSTIAKRIKIPEKMTKNIMIQNIDLAYTAEYIANVFWRKDIAKVSSITLIPQILNDTISNIAYINIDTYFETEHAYDFILEVKIGYSELEHDCDQTCWILEKNTHNAGEICVGSYTTKFADNFFKLGYDETDSQLVSIDPNHEELDDTYRPIRGPHNEAYSVEEAEDYLWKIKENIIYAKPEDKNIWEEELIHMENEFRIHWAIQNSENVTSREIRRGVSDCDWEEDACWYPSQSIVV
jgi:hypothetical protein